VSIPRDLLVDIPAADDPSFGGDTTKINAALEYGGGGVGGIRLLSLTLSELIGARFNGAGVVDFDGLQEAVDVLGGVEMCVDARVASIHTPRVFEPGCRLMDGAEVLDYLRQRAFEDGDFSRQRHHQQFLRSFLDRARSSGVLANPFKLAALMHAVSAATTLDMGGVDIPDLVYALRGVGADDVTGVRVPHYLDMIGDVSYVIATDEAQGLYDAVRDDTLDAWTAANPQWVG
jgi:LCP family protein required for cell wall assembly